MRIVNTKVCSLVTAARAGLVGASILTLNAGLAGAQAVTSDEAAAYLVLPKVIVHTTGGNPAAAATNQADTLIELINTNQTQPAALHCFYVNSNGHCSNDSDRVCYANSDCVSGGACQPAWRVIDFDVVLTPEQPLAWRASAGLRLPCAQVPDPQNPGLFIPPNANCRNVNQGQVPAVNEDPFRGELKCIEVTAFDNDVPLGRNDVQGQATIYRTTTNGTNGGIATSSYNAVGFQTSDMTVISGTSPICLGTLSGAGCVKTYASCPDVLIINHFFEGAGSPFDSSVIHTELTLVPCTEDLRTDELSAQVSTAAQILIYNEFEQRFSTAKRVQCYANFSLADIDTQPGPSDDASSIFSAGVQGTVTGQTRLRPIAGTETMVGHGLIGIAEEFYAVGGTTLEDTAAFNLNYSGTRQQGDAVYQ